MASSKLRAAVIQMNAGPNKTANIEQAFALTQQAIRRQAKLICLPEVFHFRGSARQLVRDHIAERIPGPSTRPFQELARAKQVHILLGSIYERLAGSRRLGNTSVLIDPQGRIAGRYRKRNLFHASLGSGHVEESRMFRPGRRQVSVKVGAFHIGLAVCYDVRFPKMFRDYAAAGCDVLSLPSSFTQQTGAAHWQVLVRARAIENLSYVLAPNQFGLDGKGMPTYGHSLIVGPWGDVLAEASGEKTAVLVATLDRKKVRHARSALPGV